MKLQPMTADELKAAMLDQSRARASVRVCSNTQYEQGDIAFVLSPAAVLLRGVEEADYYHWLETAPAGALDYWVESARQIGRYAVEGILRGMIRAREDLFDASFGPFVWASVLGSAARPPEFGTQIDYLAWLLTATPDQIAARVDALLGDTHLL